jgi:hypothetical protein
VPPKVIGGMAGFGAGALIAAIAFDLIPEGQVLKNWELALWLLIGAGVFVVSDRIVEARFGGEESSGPAPLGIVVGAVVDGIPESLIFGIQVAAGQPIGIAFLAAVFISNIPQALAPSADLAQAGWRIPRMLMMLGSRRPGVRSYRRARLSRRQCHRRHRGSCGGVRRGRPLGDADRLSDALRLRSRRVFRGRVDRRRLRSVHGELVGRTDTWR